MTQLQTRTSNYTFTAVRTSVSVFLILLFAAAALAQNFRTLHSGVEYAEVTHPDPIKTNLLRLDFTKVCLDVHHAMDAAICNNAFFSYQLFGGASLII